MARVCEQHVLEESDHGVDAGPPLSIPQREFGFLAPGLRRVGRVSRMHRPLYAADPVVTVAATAPLTVVTLWLQTATLLSERSRGFPNRLL